MATIPIVRAKLNDYNGWNETDAYGWTLTERVNYLAQFTHVVFAENWSQITLQLLKAVNPNVLVFRYFSLMSNPNWADYVDDDYDQPDAAATWRMNPIGSVRLASQNYALLNDQDAIVQESADSRCFDVGKPGYTEDYTAGLLPRLAGFDGVVFDYLWPGGVPQAWLGGVGRTYKSYDDGTDWYTSAWQPFFSAVCAAVRAAGYQVIGNCAGEYNSGNAQYDWQREQVNGTVYESFAVGFDGAYLTGAAMDARLQRFAADPLIVWQADGGIKEDTDDWRRKALLSYAMFLLGAPDDNRHSHHYAYDWSVFHDLVWSADLGTPTAAYTKRGGAYFYSRPYSNGLVLMNYAATAATEYPLDRAYIDCATGDRYTGALALPPYTGMILQAAETPTVHPVGRARALRGRRR